MAKIHNETFDISNAGNDNSAVENHFHVDELIALPIQVLNRKGYTTQFCCSGHLFALWNQSHIMFKEGIRLPSLPPGFENDSIDKRLSIKLLYSNYGENFENEDYGNDSYGFIRKLMCEILDAMEQLYKWALDLPDIKDTTPDKLPVTSLSSGTALIIDNDPVMRETIKSYLEKNGLTVVGEAENGEIGVELFNKLNPDYVTVDIDIPETDGFDLVERLFDTAQESDAKIIIVSEKAQKSTVLKCAENGADAFVVKPFNEKILITSIIRANNDNHILYIEDVEHYKEKLKDIRDDSTILTQREIDTHLVGLTMPLNSTYYDLDFNL